MLLWETASFPKNGVTKFPHIFRAIISSIIVDVGTECSKKNNR